MMNRLNPSWVLVLWVLGAAHVNAISYSTVQEDTTKTIEIDTTKSGNKKNSTLRLNTRLLSHGLFTYTGRIVNKHPSLDFLFNYDRKNWGYMLFKVVDLYDPHSVNNFALSVLYKHIKINNRLTVTPYTGVLLQQFRKFADHGTDGIVIILTTLKIHDHLTVDHAAIFSNLFIVPGERDWVNRIRFIYSKNHLDGTLYFWCNNRIFDLPYYTSSGFNLSYSRIKLSSHVNLSVGITGLAMLQTSHEELNPRRNGILFILTASFH